MTRKKIALETVRAICERHEEAVLDLLYEVRADLDKCHLGAAQRNVWKLVAHFEDLARRRNDESNQQPKEK